MLTGHAISKKDISYEPSDIIGIGGFSSVYKGTWSGNQVAIKIVHPNVNVDITNEINILLGLRHPNIVQIYGANIEEKPHFLVLELTSNGTLYHYLQSKTITNNEVQSFIKQVANGMNYLHGLNILHGDIKALNILVSDEKVLKISDFGLSRIKSESSGGTTTGNSVKGTLRWLSPERLEGGRLNKEVDVYAFGMICYEIASNGKVPFEIEGIKEEYQIYRLIEQKKRPMKIQDVDEHIWELIEICWSQEPKNRPDFPTIIRCLESRGFNRENNDIDGVKKVVGLGDISNSSLIKSENINSATYALDPSTKYGSNNQYLSKPVSSSGQETLYQSQDLIASSDNMYYSRAIQKETELDNLYITSNIELFPTNSLPTIIENTQKHTLATENRKPNRKLSLCKHKLIIVAVSGFLVIVLFLTLVIIVPTISKGDEPFPGKLIRTYVGHEGPIGSIIVSGDYLFSASYDKTVKQWNISNGINTRNYTGYLGIVHSLTISQNYLFTASEDHLTMSWDITNGRNISTYNYSTSDFNRVTRISSIGDYLFIGHSGGNITQLNINNKTLIRSYMGHTSGISSMFLGENFMISGSWDKTIKEWDTNTGLLIRTYIGHTDPISSVFESNNYLFSSSDNGTITQWSRSTGTQTRRYSASNTLDSIFVVGNYLFSGTYEGSVNQWDINSGNIIRTYSESENYKMIMSICVSQNYLFASSYGATVRQWYIG
ncbi:hypothetical protein HK096_006186 [Nowakowskiella sp. JEL0078]|nr:hypothetical protein HK096_006186 [Nowakowskiella sp. JEL0078]